MREIWVHLRRIRKKMMSTDVITVIVAKLGAKLKMQIRWIIISLHVMEVRRQ